MARKERQGFLFNGKWARALEKYPENVRNELLWAIVQYGSRGEIPEMGEGARMAFALIQEDMDSNNERYEETVAKRKEAGRRGGAPAGNRNATKKQPKQPKQANGCLNNQNNQKQPKQPDYDCDCDCDCDCDYGNSLDVNINPILGKERSDTVVSDTEKGAPSATADAAPSPGKSPSKPFVKPTLEEVRDYCIQRGNAVDPQTFIDFYASKGWKVGYQPMKDWKACVRTWEKRGDRGTARFPGPARAPTMDEVLAQNERTMAELGGMFSEGGGIDSKLLGQSERQ